MSKKEKVVNLPRARVFVCVPSGDTWKSGFGKSLALMFSYASRFPFPGYAGHTLTLLTVESSMLCASREKLVMTSLQKGATHVLFLDSDMNFPMTTLHQLLAREKDFICAAYTTRSANCFPVGSYANGDKVNSKGKTGIEKIQHAGFGVCLINTDCIKKLRPPLFLMDWIPDTGGYCGEDVYFSMKMEEVGVDLWVDHNLSNEIGHIGTKTYTFADVEETEIVTQNEYKQIQEN